MTIIAAFAGGFVGGFAAAVSLALLYGVGIAKGWWVL